MFHFLLEEATLSQIARKQKSITLRFPDFFKNPIKVPGIIAKGGLRMTDMGKDVWNFKVHSGSEEGKWYEVNVRWKNIVPELQRAIKNRKNWNREKTKVDLKKIAAHVFKNTDVELLCSCPADLYYGGHYIRSQDKYRAKYGEPENRSPDIRNPKQYGAFCKHIQALFKALPWYKGTMANWIKREYGDAIKTEEDKVAKRAARYKEIGRALGRRKRESIEEAVKTEIDPQKKLKDYYKDVLNTPLPLSSWHTEETWRKFWLLTDGTVIPVRDTHGDTAEDAHVSWKDLRRAGAISGYIASDTKEMGVRGDRKLTSKQISKLKGLFTKYGAHSLYADLGDSGSFSSDVKSPDQLEYLLIYGKEETWESIGEAVAKEVDPQRKLKDYYRDKSKDLTLSVWAKKGGFDWYKFWLLTDGTVIPVKSIHDVTVERARVSLGDLMDAGAFRGYIDSKTKGIILNGYKDLTGKQKDVVLKLSLKYGVRNLEFDTLRRNFKGSIKSPEHLEYLLTYGKEKAWESVVQKG
ncbi:MAG: hypothetical protein ACFFDT_10050 [Candidatus Hodarchaeota archaeon]